MTKAEIQEVSMVEVAFEIMKKERTPFDYYDLVKRVAEVKGMTKNEVKEKIANLYTDMNIDGRFHSLGDNRWGLKSWYPLEQSEEEITTPVKVRKKTKAKKADLVAGVLDDGFEDYEDEYEDLEDELDEITNDDDDDDDDDFDDKEAIPDLGDDADDADDTDEDLDDEDEELK